jgi:gag-polypeptide of LTR copia-type
MSDHFFSTTKVTLNDQNYHDWKFAVSMLLKHRGCWSIVTGEESNPTDGGELKEWLKKADDGLTIIGLTVDPSQFPYIRDAKDGPEAWKMLKDIYEKNSRATQIGLKQQFYNFKHDPHESMHTYVNSITKLASRLKGIGIDLKEDDITDVMIFNLNNEYSSIASTLMASKGDLKVSDVASALFEEE